MDKYQKDGIKVFCYTESVLSWLFILYYSYLFFILKESLKVDKIP